MSPLSPTSHKYNLDRIKDSCSCVDVVQALGLNPQPDGRDGWRCRSFRAGAENPTSMYVTARWWCDFGGDEGERGGDVIDLVAITSHGGARGPAIRDLAVQAGLSPSAVPVSLHFDQAHHLAEMFHVALLPEDREYLHARRITDATIDKLLIGRGTSSGLEDRITIPYWRAGRVVYLCGRATVPGDPTKYKKMSRDAWSDHPVWGVDTLSRKGRVIIAEGAFDVLSCWQEGLPVLSAITGRFSHEQEKDLLEILRGRDVTVCMDYDPISKAGQHFTEALARKLFGAGIRTSVVFLQGDGVKADLSDRYQRGENIVALLAGAQPFQVWETKRLSDLPDPDERKALFAKFATDMAKCFPWADVAEVFAAALASGQWEKPWLQVLAKQLQAPPSDKAVVEKLLADHRLVYSETLGWYEYSATAGVWQPREQTAIQAMLSGILGGHRTGARIKSAYVVACADANFGGEFNACRHLINFTNGMLALDTLELAPHAPEYFSTIQMSYAYEPGAVSDRWVCFVEDIANCDPARMEILQILAGYCLSGDPIYTKAFVLQGRGANGKSTYLNVLTKLLGAKPTCRTYPCQTWSRTSSASASSARSLTSAPRPTPRSRAPARSSSRSSRATQSQAPTSSATRLSSGPASSVSSR